MSNDDIYTEAREKFNTIMSASQDTREECTADRRFYSIAGAQWEGSLEDQFANKPRMEFNKIHLSIIRIINEYRNNRITVNFESDTEEELAELCDGLYRYDENKSEAQEAYDNAFEEAVGGGFGAFRFTTVYKDEEDPDDDEQQIVIEPIYDADSSVFFDLDAKRQDKRDADHCFVLTSMTPAAYEREWPDQAVSTWPKQNTDGYEFDWQTPDVVYVAEYYQIELRKETIHVWTRITGEEERLTTEEHEERKEELLSVGAKLDRTKKLRVRRVKKYLMSGGGILEECGYIAGKNIPIVPVYGKRWYVDNLERCMGHVRLAKDAQRLKNMQLSKLAEISAQSSVEKPIFTPEQIAGHQHLWNEDNVENYAYLLVNPITDPNGQPIPSGPLGYSKPPVIPPALAALLQITDADIEDLLGNQQNGEQLQGNISTNTAELIQTRLDMQTYIYLSNMAKSIKRGGEIYLSMAREVYVEKGRTMTTRDNEGITAKVELLQPMQGEDGELVTINDLSKAAFDVVVDVGPSSSTKKNATVRALTNMMSAVRDPQTAQVLLSMIMMNMEGEGIKDVKAFFRKKLVQQGVIKPTEIEQEEMAAEAEQAKANPSAEDKYMLAAAEEASAQALESQSDVILNQAKADKQRMEAAKVASEIENMKLEQALKVIQEFGARVTPEGVE